MNLIVDLFAILRKAEINIPIPNAEPLRTVGVQKNGTNLEEHCKKKK